MAESALATTQDPADLVAAARRLLDEESSETLKREWKRLRAKLNEPHFSVVVVGEFSRGKSSLINRLLDSELLPVGVLPTTALLARLRYAPELSLTGIRPDGSREALTAAPESWQLQLDGAEAPHWTSLEYGVPNGWLHTSGIQLFDTPGAGDLPSSRVEEVLDAISVADATLIAIDARMALSLTERAFIEQHVLARQVPHIAAVLTHLDEIAPASRATVLRHVRDRLATLHPQILLATAHPRSLLPADVEVGIAGPQEIAQVLSTWAVEPAHQERVHRQLFANLQRFLSLVESELTLLSRVAEFQCDEKRRQLDEERFQFEHSRLEWEDLRIALGKRCEAAVEWMEGRLLAVETALSEQLQHEVQSSSDPSLWWRQDLPHRLRQEYARAATDLGEPLEERIRADYSWLSEEVESRFGRHLGKWAGDPLARFEGEPATTAPAESAQDLGTLRWAARLGAGVASVLGFWIYGPLGMAASVGVGLAGEYLIHLQTNHQRTALAREIHPIVQRSLRRGAGTVRRRLQAQYEALLTGSRSEEELWSTLRREALESAASAEPEPGKRLANRELLHTLQRRVNEES
jgi:Dynamin family